MTFRAAVTRFFGRTTATVAGLIIYDSLRGALGDQLKDGCTHGTYPLYPGGKGSYPS